MVNDSKYENRFSWKRKTEDSLGLNEFAGYIAVALVGFLKGYLDGRIWPKTISILSGNYFSNINS